MEGQHLLLPLRARAGRTSKPARTPLLSGMIAYQDGLASASSIAAVTLFRAIVFIP